MSEKPLNHIERQLTDEERARHAQIRAGAAKDFPPKAATDRLPAPPGIPAQVRQAREGRGLTWYALAQAAGIVNQATIRDIEQRQAVRPAGSRGRFGSEAGTRGGSGIEEPTCLLPP